MKDPLINTSHIVAVQHDSLNQTLRVWLSTGIGLYRQGVDEKQYAEFAVLLGMGKQFIPAKWFAIEPEANVKHWT